MMDRTAIKTIVMLIVLIILIATTVCLFIFKIDLGFIKTASVSWISERNAQVDAVGKKLAIAETEYLGKSTELESAKESYKTEQKKYSAISDETIQVIKDATKEQEYFIEYLWITLGNYATAHKLALTVVEPGGTVSTGTSTTKTDTSNTGDVTVSTGTGVKASSDGTVTTGKETDKTDKTTEQEEKTISITEGIAASADAATIQIKGSYIDLADFVFEVENDKNLRFRLDNISMRYAGNDQVIASFKVKNLTVIKTAGAQ